MNDVILGILAIAIGALFALRGYLTMRVVIPIWGSLIGFMLGAGAVGAPPPANFMSTAAPGIVGIALAVVLANHPKQ